MKLLVFPNFSFLQVVIAIVLFCSLSTVAQQPRITEKQSTILLKGQAMDLPPDKTVPIANAEIILKSPFGQTYITKTTLEGKFEIFIPEGNYNVEIMMGKNSVSLLIYENILINEKNKDLSIEILSCPTIETPLSEIETIELKVTEQISSRPLIELPKEIKNKNNKKKRSP